MDKNFEPRIAFFSYGDPFTQQQLSLDSNTLARHLKSSIILWGKVSCPGSAILKSQSTYFLCKEASVLLNRGILIPDLRQEYETFAEYVSSNQKIFGNKKLTQEVASFLDDNCVDKIRFPGLDLSKAFMNNIIDLLYIMRKVKRIEVNWSDLFDFYDFMLKQKVVEREKIFPIVKKIIKPSEGILSIIQSLYHVLGSQVTNSDLFWPDEYNKALSSLFFSQKLFELEEAKRNIKEIEKYGILDRIGEHTVAVKNVKTYDDPVLSILDASLIDIAVIDRLSWEDVIDISNSEISKRCREIIRQRNLNLFNDSYIGLSEEMKRILRKEKTKKKVITTSTKLLGVGSIITGVVCMFAGQVAGTILTIGGITLTLGDLVLGNYINKKVRPFTCMGEMIKDKGQ